LAAFPKENLLTFGNRPESSQSSGSAIIPERMNQNPSAGRIAQELSGCFSLQHPSTEVVLEKAWYIPAEAILYRADPLPRSG
jgi:hypothetical protein